jgi:hypothetical protein
VAAKQHRVAQPHRIAPFAADDRSHGFSSGRVGAVSGREKDTAIYLTRYVAAIRGR